MEFLSNHWLDITTTALGLAHILLEYKANVWMWVVGFMMQSLGIILYYQKGLYADCGMEFYYLAMTVYGWWNWKAHPNLPPKGEATQQNTSDEQTGLEASPLGGRLEGASHFPLRLAIYWLIGTLIIWAALYTFLVTCTDSRVPLADSFTTALSFVGIWALARKYLEQWLIWIVVDIVTCCLYFYKDIPFKASLYALYVIIAICGYRRWKRMMGPHPVHPQGEEQKGKRVKR